MRDPPRRVRPLVKRKCAAEAAAAIETEAVGRVRSEGAAARSGTEAAGRVCSQGAAARSGTEAAGSGRRQRRPPERQCRRTGARVTADRGRSRRPGRGRSGVQRRCRPGSRSRQRARRGGPSNLWSRHAVSRRQSSCCLGPPPRCDCAAPTTRTFPGCGRARCCAHPRLCATARAPCHDGTQPACAGLRSGPRTLSVPDPER